MSLEGRERSDGGVRQTRAPDETPVPRGQSHVRWANAWSVLQVVRAGGAVSRSRITAETGLNAMSVHRLVADLERRQLVVPAGRSGSGRIGRPSSLFRFNASIGHVVGIDVGNETTRTVLALLDGTPMARHERPTSEIETDLVASLRDQVHDLEMDVGVVSDTLVATVIGVPAIATLDGTIVRASQHQRWDGLALGTELSRILDRHVLVRQDDQLATLAELRSGACVGARNAVVLDIGKGVGVGIVANGSVHTGVSSAAGRVAWIRVPGEGGVADWVELGSLLTADGLVRNYIEFGGSPGSYGAIDVFQADAAGDDAAARAIDRFADHLGWLIAVLVAVLDPERIVIGGGISRSFERLSAAVLRHLDTSLTPPPPVVASDLGPEAVVSGAIDAALEVGDAWLQDRISF